MKKLFLIVLLTISITLSGCQTKASTLTVMFAPTKNAEQISEGTAPMAAILKEQLNNRGYNISDVKLVVGDSYEAVGEALATGSVDMAYIPAGTYIKYEERGIKLLLTALHPGVSNNSYDPIEWNQNKPTTITDQPVSVYQSLIVAGSTPTGKRLGEVVNSGNTPTFAELNQATWCVSSPTSSSGYLYPELWLKDNYQKTFADINKQVRIKGYGDSVNSLASGVCDISVGYADFRYDYQDSWPGNIWEDTNVIGVTSNIPYDTISISNKSQVITNKMQEDLISIYQDLINLPGGKAVMDTFNHVGYQLPNMQAYDIERRVIKELE